MLSSVIFLFSSPLSFALIPFPTASSQAVQLLTRLQELVYTQFLGRLDNSINRFHLGSRLIHIRVRPQILEDFLALLLVHHEVEALAVMAFFQPLLRFGEKRLVAGP
jgi:hypothetical protein